MMVRKTFADMIVAVNAPRCSSAARPLKTWVYPQAIATRIRNRITMRSVGFAASRDLQRLS